MIYESTYELRQDLKDSVIVKGDRVEVVDLAKLQAHGIDILARSATFGTDAVKAYARWMIWEIGQELGARPASIHEFYIARARNEWSDRTVPAMNIRFTAYDTVRAALRAAKKTNAGALIFEIARS
ncbi:MAG TPA: aldolase, partial [Chloroflexi bacterium]|nr:aldolase [Chloroflexota bacterium]